MKNTVDLKRLHYDVMAVGLALAYAGCDPALFRFVDQALTEVDPWALELIRAGYGEVEPEARRALDFAPRDGEELQAALNLLELELWYRIFMHQGMGWNMNPPAWEARGTRAAAGIICCGKSASIYR